MDLADQSSSEATDIQENILQSCFPAFPLKFSCTYSNVLHAFRNSCMQEVRVLVNVHVVWHV